MYVLSSWIEAECVDLGSIKYVSAIFITALVFIVIWITVSQEPIKKMIQ